MVTSHVKDVGRDDLFGAPVTDSDGSMRRVACTLDRALEHHRDGREYLVAETRGPAATIDCDEIAQIDDYAAAVVADNRVDRLAAQSDLLHRRT